MQSPDALIRHNGRRVAVLFAGSLLAITTLGAAKADITPAPDSPLARAIFGPMQSAVAVQVPVTPLPAPPAIRFDEPLPGHAINSRFGMRELDSEDHARVHEGLDIAGVTGDPIHPTAAGEVEAAGTSASYGNFIEISHGDGISSFYAHMKRRSVLRVGEKVEATTVLGEVGSTGHSTGPHLHFEIRKDGQHYDPALFVNHAFQTLAALPFVRSAETSFPHIKAAWKSSFRLASLHGAHRGSGGRFHMQLAAR